jgi:RimJ/RimL family protein N-acetyltransferase
MFIHFETTRLILRTFEEKDSEPFSRYRSDPLVAKYQGWETPFTIERATQFIDEMKTKSPGEPGEWYQIALEIKAIGRMIGDCAFKLLAEDHAQAEIGFTLDRLFQRQGYATEAVMGLLRYIFEDLGLHRVRANCDPDNLASIRLLERVGMRHEGCFIQSLWLKGNWVSEDWYAILESEWANHQN